MKLIDINSRFITGTGLLLFVLLISQNILAQSTLHGAVTNVHNKAIPNANVLLLKAADSSLVKGMVTNETGLYTFSNVTKGKYIISITFSGYKQAYTHLLDIAGSEKTINMDAVILTEEKVQLDEVTVVTKKPLLEQKIDRLVINVANSLTSAGNTALEVLERSPGVVVDHQNNLISMNGKNGVVLMINGKISHMPVTAVVQMLAGMPSGNIEKIELITTPPANFDAEGNAGYINIILKENFDTGTNGSYSATLGYGKGLISEAALNFNHRKGNINVYGDISYSRIRKPFLIDAYNRNTIKDVLTETYFSADRIDTTRNINGRLGIDYQVNKKTVAGVLLSGYDNRYTQGESNTSRLIKNNKTDTVFRLNNSEINHWLSYSGNINLQHNFKEDEKLSLNLDYIWYRNNQPVNYFTSAFDGSNHFVYDRATRSGKVTPIHFLVGAADYNKKLDKNISMEAGLKSTVSAFSNDGSFNRLIQGTWVKDTSLSAKYKLEEDYSAAYASFNITVNKTTEVKAGLRYEYTNSNLGTETRKNIIDRHYGNFFPSLFISHQLNDHNSISFSYSRRITRPTFNDLAPFTYYADANTLITGNPALQPSIANTIKTDYTYKQYLFSLSYSNEKNSITGFQPDSDSATNKLILSPQNLVDQKTASAVLSVPVTVNKWWSMQYNVTVLWQQANAIYKSVPVTLSQFNFHINASQSFKLPKDFSAELSGFYQSKELSGIALGKSYGSLDIGIKKKMKDKKGAFLFSAGNILNSLTYKFYADLPAQDLFTHAEIRYAQRTYKLTYSRTFGKDKLKEKRNYATGAEDEKDRVH